MSYELESVEPPKYATDGSRGYFLSVIHTRKVRHQFGHSTQRIEIEGWITTAGSQTIVTLDGYPWQVIANHEALTPEWVRENLALIVGAYGWSL